jgi:prepilin-type N-terminal cleavage/methylation domain-containing protein
MVRQGLSLVEVSVAMVLAGLGVSAVAIAGNTAARLSRVAASGTGAVLAAGDVLDSLVTTPAAGSGETMRGAYRLEWTVLPGEDGTVEIQLRAWHPAARDTLVFQLLGAEPPPLVP